MNGATAVRGLLRRALAAAGMLPAARRARAYVRALAAPRHAAEPPADYAQRARAELRAFEAREVVHDLPAIFHYWSNRYLLPKVSAFGFSGPDDFFVGALADVMRRLDAPTYRFVSLGAGNCDAEVAIAGGLRARGHERFVLECLDLNETMLARGRALAARRGCAAQVVPIAGDFNRWRPAQPYHAVIANQSLHHVVALEHLFDAIDAAIRPVDGVLVTSDMIGRNGHQRWPEALAIVAAIWAELPERYKYNHQLRRIEKRFVDWDCAVDGFEGIRAQDILPLLLQRFHFELFVPFANVVTPFIDRGFGPNFDPARDEDRRLIDDIHARDEAAMQAGTIKPTQMFAVLGTNAARPTCHPPGQSPRACVRVP